MEINSISKEKREVNVNLSSDDLVKICNVLYHASNEDRNNIYYKLYGDMMMARDLCQYGHIDGFCFERIAECRKNLEIVKNNSKK